MKISKYLFGKIEIDSQTITEDLIIYNNKIIKNYNDFDSQNKVALLHLTC